MIRAFPAATGAAMTVVMGAVGACMLFAVQRVYGDCGWSAWLRTGALFVADNLSQAVSGFLALGSGVLWLLYG
ncbi:MAG TPA: hypothetical protein VHG08_29305 [Longimicrobium sp.]|nr:hypothetical protein [Longimicrobium sp.]